MNKANKERFKELYLSEQRRKYPLLPDFAIPKPNLNENGANKLTGLVKDWINLSCGQCERISNTGRVIDGRKTVVNMFGESKTIGSMSYIPGTGTKGTADLSATITPSWSKYGISIKIEIKYLKDRQSEVQKRYERQIQDAGGFYFMVRNFDDWVQIFDDFINNEPI